MNKDLRACVYFYYLKKKKEREDREAHGLRYAKSTIAGPSNMQMFMRQAILRHIQYLEDTDHGGKEFKSAPTKFSAKLPKSFRR